MDNNMKLKSFNEFNEGIITSLSNSIKSVSNSVKGAFSSLTGTKEAKELGKYNISAKKISDTEYKFIHEDRIIAELKVVGSNKFRLTIYFYASEKENTNNKPILTDTQFDKQKEKPYSKGSLDFEYTLLAVEHLIKWWSRSTNSGKSINPNFKIGKI